MLDFRGVTLLKLFSHFTNMTKVQLYPKCFMYGIYTYIYHKFWPSVGKYSIHGAYGYEYLGGKIPPSRSEKHPPESISLVCQV